ncbi:ELKS/Rab6-interacting/CAST family protein [Pedobacter mucosus]|uniref:ELKS/Rab6-interacting/CAST family protein n=1 Tax=Pedobacter mucosus TaxID=2895286 RepID=UPI001EE3DC7B|nr:ELKS/Rab6-interacting/CAST family protein [Pedobacter mucosus]UKT63052.1 ELKS/Rab6-interacting/CAST family protein [Pedobacter mucosus]
MKLEENAVAEILKDVLEQGERTQKVIENLERKLEHKDGQITSLIKGFEDRFTNIQVKAPAPDLSPIEDAIASGLTNIIQTIEKNPRPINRQLRLTLFPEQVRNPEYYQVMMRWLVWIVLGSLFMILGYMLLSKRLG